MGAPYRQYVEGVEVWSPLERLDGRDLDDDESKKFNSAWRQVQRFYGSAGRTELFGDDIAKAVARVLGVELRKKNQTFDGLTPGGGLGMQPIDIRDVTGNQIGNVEWDINWLMTTAGFRAWLYQATTAASTIGTENDAGALVQTFQGAGYRAMVTRDLNQETWAVVIWALLHHGPSPNAKKLRYEMMKEVPGDIDLEAQFRTNVLGLGGSAYADLGRMNYHPSESSFGYGLEFQDVPTGPEAIQPIGVCIGNANRFRQNANNFRLRGQASS